MQFRLVETERYDSVAFLVYRQKKNLESEMDKLNSSKQELQRDIRCVTFSTCFDRYAWETLRYINIYLPLAFNP